MNSSFSNTVLLIPNKTDIERDAVASAWENAGGKVLRVDKFWEPPDLDKAIIRIYGNAIFALVIREKKPIKLISPDDYLQITLNEKWLKRKINLIILKDITSMAFPLFAKPLIPKEFRSGVYRDIDELARECRGLSEYTTILASEIVSFESEVRCFILNNHIETMSVYSGEAFVSAAEKFVKSFLANTRNRRLLVDAYVLDIGYIKDRGWAVIEANPAWGAGLNGCDPSKAINCIYAATKPERAIDENIQIGLEEVSRILYDGTLAEMRSLKNMDICYKYNRYSGSNWDSMNIQVGCELLHADGPHYLPNCLRYFGYKHDFIDDYT